MVIEKHDFPKLRKPLSSLKRRLARRAQQILYLSGVASLYARLKGSEGALILIYHSVVDNQIASYIDQENSVTVKQFEAQLKFLKKNCHVISLVELIKCLRNKNPLATRTVVITFDDGYKDNLVNAAPLLKKYQFPATMFLCTKYVEDVKPQWIDQLFTIFQFRTLHHLQLDPFTGHTDLNDRFQIERVYHLIKRKLLAGSYQEREKLLKLVEEQLRPSATLQQLTLNWDEVRQLKKNFPLFEIGLHSRHHYDLTMLNPEQVAAEISQCQEDYARELDCKAELFSYPYGRNNQHIRNFLHSIGFLGAVKTQPTSLVTNSTDLFGLPRFDPSHSLIDLKVWLSGAFPSLSISLWGRAAD